MAPQDGIAYGLRSEERRDGAIGSSDREPVGPHVVAQDVTVRPDRPEDVAADVAGMALVLITPPSG
jgi:hypothetical protein